jgi:hypothetical protein
VEVFIVALVVALTGAAVWASLNGLRAASASASFCAVVLALAFSAERAAAAAVARQSGRAGRDLAAAVLSWGMDGAPPGDHVIRFVVADALDGDGDEGAGPSWSDALRALPGLLSRGGAAPAEDAGPGAVAIDWRTETLGWAADRNSQYDAIVAALAAARKSGARVQVVARGRGADAVLAALRRGGAKPDSLLVVGRAPARGDGALAADEAFVYSAAGGAAAVYSDGRGGLARTGGRSVKDLLAGARESLAGGAAFRAGPLAGQELPSQIGKTLEPMLTYPDAFH